MKKMTCKQLGGACSLAFTAETFEEIAELSKAHGIEMYQKGEEDHIKAMNEMRNLTGDPEAMRNWMVKKKAEFEALPDEEK